MKNYTTLFLLMSFCLVKEVNTQNFAELNQLDSSGRIISLDVENEKSMVIDTVFKKNEDRYFIELTRFNPFLYKVELDTESFVFEPYLPEFIPTNLFNGLLVQGTKSSGILPIKNNNIDSFAIDLLNERDTLIREYHKFFNPNSKVEDLIDLAENRKNILGDYEEKYVLLRKKYLENTTSLSKQLKETVETLLKEDLTHLKVFWNNISPELFTQYLGPIDLKGNENMIHLTFVPKEDNKIGVPLSKRKLRIHVKIKNKEKWRFGLSTGVFYSALNNESSYYVEDLGIIPGDTAVSFAIKEDHKYFSNFGIATQLNITNQVKSSNVELGFSAGVGIDVNLNPSYLLGFSAVLGESRRTVISLGLSANSQDVLSKKWENHENDTYNEKPEISTTKRIVPGLYGSIGINLVKKKKL